MAYHRASAYGIDPVEFNRPAINLAEHRLAHELTLSIRRSFEPCESCKEPLRDHTHLETVECCERLAKAKETR